MWSFPCFLPYGNVSQIQSSGQMPTKYPECKRNHMKDWWFSSRIHYARLACRWSFRRRWCSTILSLTRTSAYVWIWYKIMNASNLFFYLDNHNVHIYNWLWGLCKTHIFTMNLKEERNGVEFQYHLHRYYCKWNMVPFLKKVMWNNPNKTININSLASLLLCWKFHGIRSAITRVRTPAIRATGIPLLKYPL
jgi:hypothetical protein